jgi:recombination protein RecT
MAVQNSLAKSKSRGQESISLTAYLAKDAVKNQINSVVGGKDGQRFISAIVSAVTVNPALQECTNSSILSGALLGESLKLSPSPQLGHYYLVPYADNKNDVKVAQFQIGYKGYIQLAIRSGQYRKINVVAVKEGELNYFDPLNEEIHIDLITDEDARDDAETVGYYAMFELVNGFRKVIYWSKRKMLKHADRYSSAFSVSGGDINTRYGKIHKVSFAEFEAGQYDSRDAWMYSSFWYKDFDGMAFKTMLRQLISKWGVMSIDLQKAFEDDMAVISEDGTPDYVDNDSDYVDAPALPEDNLKNVKENEEEYQEIEEPLPAPADAPMTAQKSASAALFG